MWLFYHPIPVSCSALLLIAGSGGAAWKTGSLHYSIIKIKCFLAGGLKISPSYF
jgi:hypothetical protein